MSLQIALSGRPGHDVRLTRSGDSATLWIGNTPVRASLQRAGDQLDLQVDDRTERVFVAASGDRVFVHAFGRAWTLEVTDTVERSLRTATGSDAAVAPMPGAVVSVAVELGQQVTRGERLMVIESMKMHTEITAPHAGRVERIMFGVGENFEQGAQLVALEPTDSDGEAA